MVQKKSTKVTPQGGETRKTIKALTPEQVEKYLREQTEALMGCFDERLSAEDIIKRLSLKGVTPEQVEKYIYRTITLKAILDIDTTESGEIAEKTGLGETAVEDALYTIEEIVQVLQANKTTAEAVAECLHLTAEEVTALVYIIEKTPQRRDVIRHYLGNWSEEEIAKKFSLQEEAINDIINTFKEKTLSLSAKGYTIEEIGNILHYTPQCIIDTLIEQANEVKSLQAVSNQTFLREHKAGHKERVGRLTALRDHLMKEINDRGLSEVPVEKLIALYLKTEDSLRIEEKATPTIATSIRGFFNKTEIPLM